MVSQSLYQPSSNILPLGKCRCWGSFSYEFMPSNLIFLQLSQLWQIVPGTSPRSSPISICFLRAARLTKTPLPPSGCSMRLFLTTSSQPRSCLILPIIVFHIEQNTLGFFLRSQMGNLSGSTRSLVRDSLPLTIMDLPLEFLYRLLRCPNTCSIWQLVAYCFCSSMVMSSMVSLRVLKCCSCFGYSLRAASRASRYIWSSCLTMLYWLSSSFLVKALPVQKYLFIPAPP